jgi:tRNA G46 methylase TrmB
MFEAPIHKLTFLRLLRVVVNHSPRCPDEAPWSTLFPGVESPVVRHVDIGCGFGGLTVSLAKVFPDKCVLAMEIRDKVTILKT